MSDNSSNYKNLKDFEEQVPEEEMDDRSRKGSAEFAALLDASFKQRSKRLSVGDKLKGEILVIGKDEAYVGIGTMTDGIVPRRELLDENGAVTCKVGDKIDLFVTQVRGSQIFLSPKPTAKNLADDLEDAFDMMLPVEGRVAEVCKGGVRVSVHGKIAFCPISQLDMKFVENPEEYVGKKFEFRITQFSEGGRNIVVSRKKILEDEKELTAGSFLEEHREGDIVSGRVARLEKFGAFVEVAPAIDGLVHISELAWSRTNDPAEVVSVGQEIRVKILKIENKEGRLKISLSLKQAGDDAGLDPWTKAAQELPVGSVVAGKVERREPYGLFIKLSNGMTGLLPKSKAVSHPEFPFDKLHVGDAVNVLIGEIKSSERKISLDVPKDPESDEWKSYASIQNQGASSGSMGTLGGAFGAQLRAALDKKKK